MSNNSPRTSGSFIFTQTDKSCLYREAVRLRKGVKIQMGAVLVSYKPKFPKFLYITLSNYNKKKTTKKSHPRKPLGLPSERGSRKFRLIPC